MVQTKKNRVKSGRKKEGYRFPLDDWGWTEKDALDYLIKIGWAEQYHLDFNRTGCFLCPKQGEESLAKLHSDYPEQWKELMWYSERANNDFKPSINHQDLLNIEKGIMPSRKPKDPNQQCMDFE